jgi:hypothetical protein
MLISHSGVPVILSEVDDSRDKASTQSKNLALGSLLEVRSPSTPEIRSGMELEFYSFLSATVWCAVCKKKPLDGLRGF